MQSITREYNWYDIQDLIFKDIGLPTDHEQRQRGEIRLTGCLAELVHRLGADTVVEAKCYDKNGDERINDQMRNRS